MNPNTEHPMVHGYIGAEEWYIYSPYGDTAFEWMWYSVIACWVNPLAMTN